MSPSIPALNGCMAFAYLSLSATLLFVLKMASKPSPLPASLQQQPILNYGMIARAWFKKYTLLCCVFTPEKKYLLKEYLIIATFAVACFAINQVILWPVTFTLFMLPLSLFALDYLMKGEANQPGKESEKVEGDLRIQNVEIQVERQGKEEKGKCRTTLDIGILSAISFVGCVLFLECMMTLANSISNSGQLNLLSLLSIVFMDQLLMRPVLGSVFLGIVKVLVFYEKVDFENNVFLTELCWNQIQIEAQRKVEEVVKPEEVTSSPLKGIHDEVVQEEVKPSEEMFINFNEFLPPLTKEKETNKNKIEDQDQNINVNQFEEEEKEENKAAQQEVEDEEEEEEGDGKEEEDAYLTTPEKELFESQSENSHPTIVHTYLEGKENNYDSSVNCSKDSVSIKQFEPFLGKSPLDKISLPGNNKGMTEDLYGDEKKRVVGRRRKNRRELKVGGPSPYLQYLPNMLKKVQKYKNLMKSTSQPQKKML